MNPHRPKHPRDFAEPPQPRRHVVETFGTKPEWFEPRMPIGKYLAKLTEGTADL